MRNTLSALKRARKRLNRLYHESRRHTRDNKRSWHWVARQIGLSVGTTIRIARDGYEPRDNRIRALLGLPVIISMIVCSKCGAMHDQIKVCRNKRKPRRPRPRWIPPLRAAIQSAYREIKM